MEEVTDGAGGGDAERLTVSVVMPAYNAAHLLPRTVPAALEAARGGDVLVVDPGSTDGGAAVARSLGARVHELGRRAGPAEARNAGVELVDTDVVLFVDSDCVAHPDVVDRVRRAFAGEPRLVSLTGSYDDDPPEHGYASLYMNLRHHHTHQHAQREGASFWAGCGAVRRSAFVECGGFDAETYPRPMIEDIELGLRLGELGLTRLDPDLHVTHLKRWTVRSVVTTDILCRAIPWSRLIVERQGLPDDLNTRRSQRIAAALAPLALLSVPGLAVALWLAPSWSPLPAALLLASLLVNLGLFRFFARRHGPVFAVWAWAMHQTHLFYSAVTFVLVALRHRLGGTAPVKEAP